MTSDNPPTSQQHGSQAENHPTCPRHPDRVSYVTCKNCGRPVCGDCQVPTEVGVLCVDCHSQARKDAQQVQRDRAGGRGAQVITDKHGRVIPVVTYTLIALCVIVYAGQWISSLTGGLSLTGALQYAGLYTSEIALATGQFEPWRMITSAFVHSVSNPLHLVLNMLVLWMLGRELEPALGWARFLALYLVSALGGSVAVLLLSDPLIPVVGASGAVYGLFAAIFLLVRASGGELTSITVLIVVNLVFSFVASGVSWQGHVGGLIAGGILAGLMLAVFNWQRKKPAGERSKAAETAGVWISVALVLALLVVLTLWGASRVTIF